MLVFRFLPDLIRMANQAARDDPLVERLQDERVLKAARSAVGAYPELAGRLAALLTAAEASFIRDQLGLLAARCQWVANEQHRHFLEGKIERLGDLLRRLEQGNQNFLIAVNEACCQVYYMRAGCVDLRACLTSPHPRPVAVLPATSANQFMVLTEDGLLSVYSVK